MLREAVDDRGGQRPGANIVPIVARPDDVRDVVGAQHERLDELDANPPFVAGTFIVAGSRLALLDLDALLALARRTSGATADTETR